MDRTELAAAVITLAGVFFTARARIIGWVFGIAGSALYVLVCYNYQLYAETVLQLFYVVMGFYGWWKWMQKGDERIALSISRMPVRVAVFSALVILAGTLITGRLLDMYSDTDVPYPDAAMGMAGLVITWQMARKYLQNWLWWIVADVLNSFLFVYKTLYATAVLYIILAILAAYGYIKWKKELNAT